MDFFLSHFDGDEHDEFRLRDLPPAHPFKNVKFSLKTSPKAARISDIELSWTGRKDEKTLSELFGSTTTSIIDQQRSIQFCDDKISARFATDVC